MANPLRKMPEATGEKSPLDPKECCEWANARMRPDLAALGYRWVTTDNWKQPIALRKPITDR